MLFLFPYCFVLQGQGQRKLDVFSFPLLLCLFPFLSFLVFSKFPSELLQKCLGRDLSNECLHFPTVIAEELYRLLGQWHICRAFYSFFPVFCQNQQEPSILPVEEPEKLECSPHRPSQLMANRKLLSIIFGWGGTLAETVLFHLHWKLPWRLFWNQFLSGEILHLLYW